MEVPCARHPLASLPLKHAEPAICAPKVGSSLRLLREDGAHTGSRAGQSVVVPYCRKVRATSGSATAAEMYTMQACIDDDREVGLILPEMIRFWANPCR